MAAAETARLIAELTFKDNLSKGIGSATLKIGQLESSMSKITKGTGQVVGGLGKLAFVAGAALVTGLGASAKAAIDFEDAFAGVRKTVEGTPPDLDKLDKSLRALSTRIPVDYSDLAGIAQEAGALGVPTEDVARFTEVVSRLSAATVGLSTDAAAEAFGKLGNLLKIHGADYEKAGSALVALGNAGASSEVDIVEVAKRFGAAGAAAGLSTAQVLGFSSAIASLGQEPEAAGTALSRLFNNITLYIGTGNKKLNEFAKVSGLTAKQFTELYAKDASGAVQLFLQKLSTLDKFQQAAALKEAGISNVRSIAAVIALSQNYGELARQVDLSTEAYDANTALQETSAKRFDTLKARLKEFKNGIIAAAASIGEGFTPALSRAVAKFSAFLALPKTQGDLIAFGKKIGDAIDGIDWKGVLEGAQKFADVLGRILDIVGALPSQVKLIGGGLLAALNTPVIGGAIGDIGKGLGNILSGLFGRYFARGSSPANPVFVSGGIGGGGGVAGGGGGLLGKVAIVGGVLLAGATIIELSKALAAQSASNAQGEAALTTQTKEFTKVASSSELQKSLDGLLAYQEELLHGSKAFTAEGIAFAFNIDGIYDNFQEQIRLLRAQIAEGPKPSSRPQTGGLSPDDRAGLPKINAATGFRTNLAESTAATAAHAIKSSIFTTSLADLIAGIRKRSAARFGGTGLGPAAVDATFQRDILRAAKEVASSSAGLGTKVADLKTLQSLLTQNGDTETAKKVQALIDSLTPGAIGAAVAAAAKNSGLSPDERQALNDQRAAIKAAAAAATYAGQQTAAAIRDKNFSPAVTVNVNATTQVSIRDTAIKVKTFSHYGNVAI